MQHVPFAYQLELTVGTDVDEVLETVETTLVDQLLPYTFRECTEDDLITDMITGLRGALHDQPVDGVACTTVMSSPLNICFVIRGHLDVYLAVEQAAAIVRQAIQLDLHAILDHHAVDHVAEGVVAVSFVDVATLPPPPPQDESEVTGRRRLRQAHDHENVPMYVGMITLLLATLAWTWRQIVYSHTDDLQDNYLPLQDDASSSSD